MQDALAASAVNASFVSRRRVVSSYTVRSLGTKIAFAPPQPFRVRALKRSRRSKRRTRVPKGAEGVSRRFRASSQRKGLHESLLHFSLVSSRRELQ